MKYYMLFFAFILAFTTVLPYGLSALKKNDDLSEISDSSSYDSSSTFISVKKDGIICSMNIEDWTLYALSYEMPENSPTEFAKALAVAMRTYAAYHLWYGDKKQDHPECDFCSDPTHCKGLDCDSVEQTAKNAVNSTAGELIYYNRCPINPIMHISSSVMTESAKEAMGIDVPYLRSVSTPDESKLEGFSSAVSLAESKVKATLEKHGYTVSGDCQSWITYVSYTAAGRVRSVFLCGQTISGKELAEMFGLSSLNFTMKASSEKIVFETEGIGNGLGMSEYGAYLMAEAGSNYDEILTHYYQGTYIV